MYVTPFPVNCLHGQTVEIVLAPSKVLKVVFHNVQTDYARHTFVSTVHNLSPKFVDVIAAMGDSITVS